MQRRGQYHALIGRSAEVRLPSETLHDHGHPGTAASANRDQSAPQQKVAYSMISSAVASSVGGTSRPSALAVLRLITSSYLVGACTGRSPGFAPRKMRST